MQEVDPGSTKPLLVVLIFLTNIDDGPDPVFAGKLLRAFYREAAANGEIVREPVEVRCPRVLGAIHRVVFIFIFFTTITFFFIISLALLLFYC